MRLGSTSDRQRKVGYTQDGASFLSLCVRSSRDSYTVDDVKGKSDSYPEPETERLISSLSDLERRSGSRGKRDLRDKRKKGGLIGKLDRCIGTGRAGARASKACKGWWDGGDIEKGA
jgi:hypothetical protein